ncbi:MAG: Spy/CpxP family protein refolding chaperone [Phycisphaeraceae bacterium]|nr:Spy/CpxP family protein refolding chaperone [Phycisphaeraceae bacterium]
MNRLHRIIAGSALAVAMTGGGVCMAQTEKEAPPPQTAQQNDQANAPQRRGDWRPPQDGQDDRRGDMRGDMREGMRDGMRPGGSFALLRGIELTDEQREQVKQIMQESREQREAWRNEHKDEVKAAQDEVDKAREALRRAEEKMRNLMENAPGGPKDTAEKIKSILTDDQKAQLEANIEKMKEQGPPPPPGDMMGGRDGQDGDQPRMNWRRDGGQRPEGEQPRRRQGDQPPPPPAEN